MDGGWIAPKGGIALGDMLDLEQRGMHRLKINVCSDEQVLDGVAKISAEQGRIDGVLANAGYTCMGMFELVSIEEAKKQYEVNVFGLARTVKAVLPHMRRAAPEGNGRIVLMSSAAGKVSPPGMGWYPSTKHAVEALADALRREMIYCFPGIEVVLIEPDFIPTELYNASEPTWHTALQDHLQIFRGAQLATGNPFI